MQDSFKKDRHGGGPLSGIRVIDLTSVIMGPYATHILADMGADVIKVESPEGDSTRGYQPSRNPGMSGMFINLNRNKRSICLDLKSARCREALDRLITTADVLLHNLRPSAMQRLGYPYERVRTLNAGIIHCGAFGFGSRGPYRDKPAYDDMIQAGSGLAALGVPIHGEPAYVPTVVCDKLAGQAIAYGILAALFQRERGGGGQAIEVPMFEASIEFNFIEHIAGFAFEPPLGEPGFPRVLNKYRKPYKTRDGYACILPYSDKNWQDFYHFTGRHEFKADSRFFRLSDRVLDTNIKILYKMLEEEAAKRTTAEWVQFCDRVGIPCMPVIRLQDLEDDPHVKAVDLFVIAEHPTEGRYRTVRPPVSFGSAPFQITLHAPRHGQHTAEVLGEIGLSADEISRILKTNGSAIV